MMKKIITSVAVVAALSTSAFAFEQMGVKAGNNVVGLDLRYFTMSPDAGDSTDTVTISGSFSHFMTANIELGIGLGYSYNESSTSDNTNVTWTPFVQYNFVDFAPTTVPYVGVGVALLNNESTRYATATAAGSSTTTSETGYSAEAGLKVFMSEKAAITPAIYYEAYDGFSNTGLKVALQAFF